MNSDMIQEKIQVLKREISKLNTEVKENQKKIEKYERSIESIVSNDKSLSDIIHSILSKAGIAASNDNSNFGRYFHRNINDILNSSGIYNVETKNSQLKRELKNNILESENRISYLKNRINEKENEIRYLKSKEGFQ